MRSTLIAALISLGALAGAGAGLLVVAGSASPLEELAAPPRQAPPRLVEASAEPSEEPEPEAAPTPAVRRTEPSPARAVPTVAKAKAAERPERRVRVYEPPPEEAAPEPTRATRNRPERRDDQADRRALFLERFDTDGDGEVSDEERQAAREQFRGGGGRRGDGGFGGRGFGGRGGGGRGFGGGGRGGGGRGFGGGGRGGGGRGFGGGGRGGGGRGGGRGSP